MNSYFNIHNFPVENKKISEKFPNKNNSYSAFDLLGISVGYLNSFSVSTGVVTNTPFILLHACVRKTFLYRLLNLNQKPAIEYFWILNFSRNRP